MTDTHVDAAPGVRVGGETRLADGISLPLPAAAARVLALLREPDTSPGDLDAALSVDDVLVARLIGLVNSPFYGLRRISTMRHAIMVLGYRGLRSLVLASAAATYLKQDHGWYGHEPRGLMQHAMAVAAAARAMGKVAGQDAARRETLFAAGLLHDIGKVVLLPALLELGVAPADGRDSAAAIEQRALGVDHGAASAEVCRSWNVERVVRDLVAAHHRAPAPEASRGAAFLRLADALAHEREIGFAAGRAPQPIFAEADLEAARLLDDRWELARAEAHAAIDAAVSSFGAL